MAVKIDDDLEAYSDINVTPLVDVMLVLLIIFMVTAPLLHQGVEVKLPKSVSQNLPTTPEDPLILSITRKEVYYLNETPIPKQQLRDRLKLILRNRKDRSVYLKADRNLPYGVVVETMDVLNRLGVENLGMVTRAEEREGIVTVSEILEERIRRPDAPHGLATASFPGGARGLRRLSRPHLAAPQADDPAPLLAPRPGRLARRPGAPLVPAAGSAGRGPAPPGHREDPPGGAAPPRRRRPSRCRRRGRRRRT